ncbi:hypothetical protein GQR58_006909 [Nymphon striatum]|nr:hypothetical protein GQR58_006909 [Nymphon striatum]
MADKMPVMDWPSCNQSESFKLFKQRLKLYFTVKNIKKEEQSAYILLAVGQEGLRKFNSWDLSDDEISNPAVIFEKFEEMIEPTENFRVSRLKLSNLRQQNNQSLDDFVSKCKLLANKCGFRPNELQERIIELITASTPIPEFQKELLAKPKTLTLSETLSLGRSHEATNAQVSALRAMNQTKVMHTIEEAKEDNRKTKSSTIKDCRNCGLDHKSRQCPAFGKQCNKCGKRNHWAKKCRSKESNNIKMAHEIKEENSDDDDSYGFEVVNTDSIQKDNFAVVKLSTSNGIKRLKAKVDTGAQANILNYNTYRALVGPNHHPSTSKISLTSYGNNALKNLGKITFKIVQHRKKLLHNVDFYISEHGNNLLGLKLCTALGIVKFPCHDAECCEKYDVAEITAYSNKNDLIKTNSDIFEGIGRIDNEVRNLTATDSFLQAVIPYITCGWPSEKNQCNEVTHAYWQHRTELALHNGLLLKGNRIIIPTEMRPNILRILHKQHQGIEKTRLRARQAVYWPGLNADIEKMIQNCDQCQTFQRNNSKLPVQPIHTTCAMQTIGVDIFDFQSVHHLLTVDYFTGYIWVNKLNNMTSSALINKLDNIFCQFGYPEKLISDNGPQLTSHEFQEYCQDKEIHHSRSAPHHQQGNGRAERNIGTVKSMMKKSMRTGEKNLQEILSTLRDTPISTEIPSPYVLMFPSRKIKSNLPVAQYNNAQAINCYQEDIEHRANSYAGEEGPAPIPIGANCRFQKQPGDTWQKAKISCRHSDRNYTVETSEGTKYQRDRVHIKPDPQTTQRYNLPLDQNYECSNNIITNNQQPTTTS